MTVNIEETVSGTLQKYIAILSSINRVQARLQWSEIAFIFLNIAVFFPTAYLLMCISSNNRTFGNSTDVLIVLLCHVIGIFINSYWTASSMRLQLKLKLNYFQARFLERKMNAAGEFIISDEELFFNPQKGRITSPDGEETLIYPAQGAFRMDGFVGAARPRILSICMPLLFFIIYLTSFFSLIFTIL